MVAQGKSLNECRSPIRVLAACFQKGRDNWKQKYMDAKTELKRFKVRVADVCQSRDAWRAKAEARQIELQDLQAQIQELQNQSSEGRQTTPVTDQK